MSEIGNKERIQQKAHDLFMEYGLRSVSMDDIANALGISKKTIYQFFADKDELVQAVLSDVITNNKDCCERDVSVSENAVHEIFIAMDMIVETLGGMNPSLLFEMQKYHPTAYEKFRLYKNEFLYNVMRRNLLRGIEEGLYREDIDVEIISRFRVESIMVCFSKEFQTQVKQNLVTIEQEIIQHYVCGIANMKGHKLILKYKQERQKKQSNHAATKVK